MRKLSFEKLTVRSAAYQNPDNVDFMLKQERISIVNTQNI